jgi:hypothetical protein
MPEWFTNAVVATDLSRLRQLDAPEVHALVAYLDAGPEAGSSTDSSATPFDLLYNRILTAAAQRLALECCLIADPHDFNTILKRVCSWFHDMRAVYDKIQAEKHVQERKMKVKEDLRRSLVEEGLVAPHTLSGLTMGPVKKGGPRLSMLDTWGEVRQNVKGVATCCLKKMSKDGYMYKVRLLSTHHHATVTNRRLVCLQTKDVQALHQQRLLRMTNRKSIFVDEVDAFLLGLQSGAAKAKPKHRASASMEADIKKTEQRLSQMRTQRTQVASLPRH